MSSIVYGALDVHKESLVAELLKPETGERISDQLPNDRQRLVRAAQRWSKLGELRLCYEAGSAGYVIQRWLSEAGFHCEVIAPSLVPKAPGERVKTDRRDARNLVKLYAAGLLRPVHIPSPEDEAVRALVRLRQDLTRDMTRAKNRIIKYLATLGYHYREGKTWTQKHRVWLRALPLDVVQELILRTHLEQLDALLEQRQAISLKIEEIASSEAYREKVGRLMCLRSVDVQSAMGLLMEVIDPHRFATAPQLMSFFGLVPKEHSSGDSHQRGGITKTGRSRARWILGQAAWNQRTKPGNCQRLKKHWKTQPEAIVRIAKKAERRLYDKFWKIALRKDRKTAVTAVAREMAGFVWAPRLVGAV